MGSVHVHVGLVLKCIGSVRVRGRGGRAAARSAGQERAEVPVVCKINKGAGIVPRAPRPAEGFARSHADVPPSDAARKDPDRVDEDTDATSA